MQPRQITKERISQILAVLAEDPSSGLTASELITATGLKPHTMYQTLTTLRRQGLIHKTLDRRWHSGSEPEPRLLASVSTNTLNRVVYPFPLSTGDFAYASLPPKLSKADAQRIAAFVDIVAIDQ